MSNSEKCSCQPSEVLLLPSVPRSPTKAAKVLVAIDGCPALCAKKTLDHAALPPQIHLIVTELGIEQKSGYLDFSEDELALCRSKLEQELDAEVALIPARG